MTDFALVSPEEFAQRLTASDREDPPLVLEAHFSSFDHPLDGDQPVSRHLPGAIQIHPSYLEAGTDQSKYYPHYECPSDGNVLSPDRLKEALAALGISSDREVWIYGTEPDGIMAAARLIWGLFYAGVETIRLLDGGLEAWIAAGEATVSSIPHAVDLAGSVGELPGIAPDWKVRSEFLASLAEVQQIASSGMGATSRLVDVRRPGEYDGSETKYYPFFSKAGHIPRAVLQGNWINLVDGETRKVGPALTEVRRRWIELGIVDESVERGDTPLIFYCGTGWRSSLSFLVANLLGYRAKNFDDGFYGWSWTDENEVAYCDPTAVEDELPGRV
ncbi:MAG: rhodanese-like domain-containing protein [Verrucomicrobiales bacterium]|nr:rhodanese-like domain-containing protein [Verrucomicrobiales bacterium]